MLAHVFRCSPNNGHCQDTSDVRFAPTPDVQNYRNLRTLKSVRTSSFPAPGFVVVRQHLRGAADAAPKGVIERDAAKPPAVRPAGPVDLPLRGPSKVPIIPDQVSDQGAEPGRTPIAKP